MSLTALEQNARRAKEANSFSDYKPGSATAEYQEYCKEAEETAQKAKDRLTKTGAPAERAEGRLPLEPLQGQKAGMAQRNVFSSRPCSVRYDCRPGEFPG